MSIAIMTQCWPVQCRQTLKLLLLALADNADDDGVCWPSIDTISRKCSTDRRTIFRQLLELEQIGHISRELRRGHSNIYHVHPAISIPDGTEPTRDNTPPVVCESPTGVLDVTSTRGSTVTQNHQLNRHEPPKRQRARKPKKSDLPENLERLEPSERLKAYCEKHGETQIKAHLIYFVGYAKANGKQYADWDQAVINAIRCDWAGIRKAGL